ncbi:MAG: hypothetical protein KAR40_15305 [Candidatus Sabulitectum sp.]|nr:hypothetical protein [Candidatus Sabulitectum sp.]
MDDFVSGDDDPLGFDEAEAPESAEGINLREAHQVAEREYRSLSAAFKRVFGEGQPLPDDAGRIRVFLARFCRADTSTFDKDARVHALLEGRREVYQLVYDLVGMREDDIVRKYEGRMYPGQLTEGS